MVEEKISLLPTYSNSRGPRGATGRDGQSFNFSDHEDQIKTWAKEFALGFEDLDDEQINSLKGQRGKDGEDGRDGHDFNWEDNRERISAIIKSTVGEMSEDLKLKFTDLSEKDIEQLRGPRGRDGNNGRGFNFEEHKEFFESLKLKFSDLSETEKETLKLKFSELSESDRESLKLKFKDLTQEDISLIRGPRGMRGQRGTPGKDGDNGKDGISIRGLPGMIGPIGLTGYGRDGQDGESGKDAPYIVDVEVNVNIKYEEMSFTFIFSDGSEIKTNEVKLPISTIAYIVGGGGSSNSGSGGSGGDSGPDNFSYSLVDTGETKVVPLNQQMMVEGQVTVRGHLTVLGELIDISNRQAEQFFYDLIDTGDVVQVNEDRLLQYHGHLTVLGHLRVNGRVVDTAEFDDVETEIFFGKVVLGAGGDVTVSTSHIFSTSVVQLTASLLPLNGKLHYDTVVDGVSFNIHTGNNSDNGNTIDWLIAN